MLGMRFPGCFRHRYHLLLVHYSPRRSCPFRARHQPQASTALLMAAPVAASTASSATATAGAGRGVVIVGAGDIARVAPTGPVLAPASPGLVVLIPRVLVPFVRVSLPEVVHRLFVMLVSHGWSSPFCLNLERFAATC